MRATGRLLYFVCFAALAIVAALSLARVGRPSIAPLLVWAALAAAVAGAPGLVHRRAWPAALVLLTLGAYLLLRVQSPVPARVHGLGGQYEFYLGQLRAAGHAYATHTFPFDLADAASLKLLLALIVYGATGLASLAGLSLRKALPAVAIFLALMGFGLTVDGSGRVVLLPLVFLLLTVCLLTLSRSLGRRRWAPAGVAAGAVTAVVASLLALLLLATTPVASGKPWQDWSTWGVNGGSPSHLAFDWMLNFPGLLDSRTDAPVMRVESPLASYWRANALDAFSGTAWLGSGSSGDRLSAEGIAASDTFDIPAGEPAPSGKTVTEIFDVRSLYTDFLFAGGTPTTLVFAPRLPVFTDSELALRLRRPVGPAFTYALTAVVPQAKPADLVGRGRDYPQDVLPDTALPFPAAASVTGATAQEQWRAMMNDTPADREWRDLYQLDRQIVRAATDPYQVTLRIEQYLRSNYIYSLTPPPTRYQSPYAAFLFDTKTGYCQHFAGAMAALVRFNGIPARVAVGFTTGALVAKDTYSVSRTDAHAWVEVYFPGVGWTAFDPTPGGGLPGAGPSSTSAGFVDPFRQDRSAGGPAAAATAAPKLQGLAKGPTGKKPNPGAASSAAPSTTPDWLPWTVALAVVLVAWPVRTSRRSPAGPASRRPGAPPARFSRPDLRRAQRLRRRRAAVTDARRDFAAPQGGARPRHDLADGSRPGRAVRRPGRRRAEYGRLRTPAPRAAAQAPGAQGLGGRRRGELRSATRPALTEVSQGLPPRRKSARRYPGLHVRATTLTALLV